MRLVQLSPSRAAFASGVQPSLEQMNQAPRLLDAGDAITIEGREPCTWANPTESPTDVVWALVPAAWSRST